MRLAASILGWCTHWFKLEFSCDAWDREETRRIKLAWSSSRNTIQVASWQCYLQAEKQNLSCPALRRFSLFVTSIEIIHLKKKKNLEWQMHPGAYWHAVRIWRWQLVYLKTKYESSLLYSKLGLETLWFCGARRLCMLWSNLVISECALKSQTVFLVACAS